ncbi:hypothetical protein KCU78_g2205, partial [Aureobasidium melanogenum]
MISVPPLFSTLTVGSDFFIIIIKCSFLSSPESIIIRCPQLVSNASILSSRSAASASSSLSTSQLSTYRLKRITAMTFNSRTRRWNLPAPTIQISSTATHRPRLLPPVCQQRNIKVGAFDLSL